MWRSIPNNSAAQPRRPRLWWPAQMGNTEPHDLALSFEVSERFRIPRNTHLVFREITCRKWRACSDRFKRLFKVNGKNILIRGGGWTRT